MREGPEGSIPVILKYEQFSHLKYCENVTGIELTAVNKMQGCKFCIHLVSDRLTQFE